MIQVQHREQMDLRMRTISIHLVRRQVAGPT